MSACVVVVAVTARARGTGERKFLGSRDSPSGEVELLFDYELAQQNLLPSVVKLLQELLLPLLLGLLTRLLMQQYLLTQLASEASGRQTAVATPLVRG